VSVREAGPAGLDPGGVHTETTEEGQAPAVQYDRHGNPFPPRKANDRVSVVSADIQLLPRLKAIWQQRELLMLFIRTDLKVRYKESILGYFWSMLNPALVLGIYYVIFRVISRSTIPNFAIWLFCGLMVWNLFNNASMMACGAVVGRAGIVKKVAFPRELLALSQVGVAIFLFAIQAAVMVIVLVAFGLHPDYEFLAALPLAFVVLIVLASAFCVFLSAVNVYLRDTQHLTEVLLMAWFWATPIVYAYGTVAPKLRHYHLLYAYLIINPITPIAMTFQRAIYGKDHYYYLPPGSPPGTKPILQNLLPHLGLGYYVGGLAIELLVACGLFLLALVVFGKLEGNFAEEL
jgi:ABC-2 type transport system permease protein